MPSKVVVGAQWGDEGKGKIIDILSSKSDIIIRSQGGNNAGHTVIENGKTYKFHLIPSGILYKKSLCLIGCGTVIDPKSILSEIDDFKSKGIDCDNLRIDPRAHVIMPWHIIIDKNSEKMRGKNQIGTTHRGIGPCYMDKAERSGIRIFDLISPEILKEKILNVIDQKNEIISKIYKTETIDKTEIIKEYTEYGQRLKKYVEDVSILAYEAYNQGKSILFEGAQGTLLDINTGTYPFVTSSHPTTGGVCTGTGIGPTMIDEVLGVAKSYTTRVGYGSFPTELDGEIRDFITERGKEYGTTTGRQRRVGWFDAVIVKHSIRINGITGLCINKLDTLSGLKEIKVCTEYKTKSGKTIKNFPSDITELEQCTPVYKTLKGFDQDISNCKSFDELPEECKNYIKYLETECNCKISMIGVGPDREQNILL